MRTPALSHNPDLPTTSSPQVNSVWRYTLLVAMVILLWDASGLDRLVTAGFADANGFVLRHNWWLERVFHDGARQLAILLFLGLWLAVWRPIGWLGSISRLERLEAAIGISLSLLLVSGIKHYSLTSCPWDLQVYGGYAQYLSHWAWGLKDGGSGHCFPGGHASAAFAYLALPLPWLLSASLIKQQLGRRILWGVLAAGMLLGATQTLRGAHYPSHTLWTGMLCWLTALANHQIFAMLGQSRRPARLA